MADPDEHKYAPGSAIPESNSNGTNAGRAAWALAAVLLLLIVGYFSFKQPPKDHRQVVERQGFKFTLDKGVKALPADGRSNLPGNFASLTYNRSFGDFEDSLETNNDWIADGRYWHAYSIGPDRKLSRIQMVHGAPSIPASGPALAFDTTAKRDAFARRIAAAASERSGERVRLKKTNFGAYQAYTYTFFEPTGFHVFHAIYVSPQNLLRASCWIAPNAPEKTFRDCVSALRSIQINDPN